MMVFVRLLVGGGVKILWMTLPAVHIVVMVIVIIMKRLVHVQWTVNPLVVMGSAVFLRGMMMVK
jgi:hypothetical protein